nr:hypothetical protein [Tanacetum cinerariifolium]
MVAKFEAHKLEINRLKARVKPLEDREGVAAKRSRDDAPIKERNLDEGKAAAERVSDDTEEMETVLTSMDATTVLASGVAEVPTGSGSIPTAGPPAAEVPTGSEVVPTAGPIFATATVVTPYTKRKGKETLERIVGNKIHKAFLLPVIKFPLPVEVPTASEESCHCQKKREATAVKIALLLKSRRNYQSKSDDSYA